jgi:hypothetical protein
MVPVGGLALLAVTTTYGWSPGARLLVGAVGLAALLGIALVGSRDATTGSPFGFAVVALTTGLLTLPGTAPLAGVAAVPAGPGEIPPVPFAAGAAAALAGALATALVTSGGGRPAVLAGHGLAVAGVGALLCADPAAGPWTLTAALVPLGAGVGMALAAALRDTGLAAALFGLALCFPAVLIGQLIVLSLQSARIELLAMPITDRGLAIALTEGYRVWLVAAGALAVPLAGAVILSGPRRRGSATGGRGRSCTVDVGGDSATAAPSAR